MPVKRCDMFTDDDVRLLWDEFNCTWDRSLVRFCRERGLNHSGTRQRLVRLGVYTTKKPSVDVLACVLSEEKEHRKLKYREYQRANKDKFRVYAERYWMKRLCDTKLSVRLDENVNKTM
jgi:hypothetical protein